MLAMVVNDDAGEPDTPWSPQVFREHARSYRARREGQEKQKQKRGGLTADLIFADTPQSPVGASLLAIDVNDNAPRLDERGAWKSIASRLAPTMGSQTHLQSGRL
jgi:hypothetical protein